MTTVKDVKAFAAPLLARHPNLVLVKRWLIFRPLHHTIRGVNIDRSGDPQVFSPQVKSLTLYTVFARIPTGFTEPVYGVWRKDDPDASAAFARKCEADILPLLARFETIEGDLAYWSDPARGYFSQRHSYAQIADHLALGDIDIVRHLLRDELNRALWMPTLEELGLVKAMLHDDGSLDCSLVERLVERLRNNEERMVEHHGLGRVWERRPFPIETKLLS